LKFSAAQLYQVVREYLAELERAGEGDVLELAERLLTERERSLHIDASLESEARQQEQGAPPHQFLLLGRDRGGLDAMLASLSRLFPVLEEHTRLDAAGLRQLAIDVNGIHLCLMDIGGSHAGATSNPTRLRKATKHFGDTLAGAVVVTGIDDLCSPDEAQLVSQLVAVMATCCASSRRSSDGGCAQSAPLYLVLSSMDRIPDLRASGKLRALGVDEGEADTERIAGAARTMALAQLTPAVAASVLQVQLSMHAETEVGAVAELIASTLASIKNSS